MTLNILATLGGIDIGFWISMGISLLVAIVMNVVFWSLKPKNNKKK